MRTSDDGTGHLSDLVLLHGITMSGRAWTHVVPHLAPHHRVHTPTVLGHRGGRAPARRPVTFDDLLGDVLRYLDDQGLDRPHVAGNSLGGWLGVELARRGRAATVCGLASAGFWDPESRELEQDVVSGLRSVARLVRRTRHVSRVGLRSARVRRRAFAAVAERGDLLSPALAHEVTLDLLACEVLDDTLDTPDSIRPLETDCPIRLVWGEHDKLFPASRSGVRARAMVPSAVHHVMPGVGHVTMIDDPVESARQILLSTGALTA